MKTAELVIDFLSTLSVPEGPAAGQPLRLAEYQQRFIRGAMEPDTMVGILSIGRGNPKTALSAGIALACLMGVYDAQPKREIILAARNRDQARIGFQFVVVFVEGLGEDAQEDFIIRRGSKLEVEYKPNGGGLVRCIAAYGKSILGGAPNLAILDERAAWETAKGDALENAILSGLGKRGGKALIISTSAPDDANSFSRWIDDPPPGTYVQEHRPSPGLPADDEESLIVANPGCAEDPPIGAPLGWLKAQAARAIARGGSALQSFRNLNRNERVSSEDRSLLLTVDEWLACEVGPDDLPPREGICVIGLDLGGSASMTAAAFYWPETGRLEAKGWFPTAPSLTDRGENDGVAGRYVEMNGRGELEVIGDRTVPVSPVLVAALAHVEGCQIGCLVMDRYKAAELSEGVQRAGIRVPLIWRGFGWKDGSEDIERLRRAAFEGKVKTTTSLLLRSAFADAVTLIDPAGNHKLAKARSTGRIDAAAATVIAVAEGQRRVAVDHRPARVAWA